jgi:hypothetical protein
VGTASGCGGTFDIPIPSGGTKANIPAFATACGFFFAGLAAVVGGGASLYFAHLHSKDKSESREGIFEDMTAFAASCKRVPIGSDKSA